MIAKGTRSNKLLPSYRPVEKLGIIACNLIGPFEIPTFDDGKYILTIRDLSTSYSKIKILKNKGETAKILMEQITKFETVTGKKVKCIRSDNGGEFKSNVLAEFIKSKGIRAERSLPYHHYQNSAIKRFNRTIKDMGCAALTDSCLPKSFWGFAFLWANYTLNRLPNKVSGNITPFEAFHGYRPVLDDLRIFGAKAFVLTPPEKRKKLDDRAREARVVGYVDGGKGWMLWDQADNKIVYSAWVQFADNPLRPSTGERQINDNLDPKLLRKEQLEDQIGDVLDPALCQRASALRFVMACELGDFTAEETVQSQETLIDRLSKRTTSPTPPPPKKYKDILKHPDREAWLGAIQEELKNLFRHDIWTIELVPEGKRVMGARWVFVEKRTQDGKLIKLKARYVAKGYAQIAGVEFLDTFAPTATFVSL
jgi:transposase InsO family protein